MKAMKLLAALAIPAMFAACTNEEIIDNTPQQNNPIEGAEIIAKGMSFNLNEGLGSRFAGGEAGWGTKDRIGLGWLVCEQDFPFNPTKENRPDSPFMFANDLFEVNNGAFTTKANIYKGWHFSYYPYEYMETINDEPKELIINKPQTTGDDWFKRQAENFFVSEMRFLTKDSLDENQQLNYAYKLQYATNNIVVQSDPEEGSAFAKGGYLADLKIKSIKLNAGVPVFASKAKFFPHYLPEAQDEVVDSLYKVVVPYDGAQGAMGYNKSITTNVEESNFVVSETARMITITVPYYLADPNDQHPQQGLDLTQEVKSPSMTITTNRGTFTIKKVKNAEEGSSAAINNAAIDQLIAAYAADGALRKPQGGEGVLMLEVKLYDEIFKADKLIISNLEEWNEAKALAEGLSKTEETFWVDDTIHFENEIPMPEGCTVTVKPASTKFGCTTATQPAPANPQDALLCIDGTLAVWPEALTSEVDLVVDGIIEDATGIAAHGIVNNGTMILPAGESADEPNALGEGYCRFINKGTIELGEYAKLAGVDNSEGTIVVVYGSYVELAENTEAGTIAYEYNDGDYAYQLNNLIATKGQSKYARVNTLIINEEFDINMKDADGVATEDPYTGTTGATTGESLVDMTKIKFIMQGGSIVKGEGSNSKIGDLEVESGENTIKDVVPASITVLEDATLNIEGDDLVTTAELEVEGTLNVNTNTIVKNIVNNGTIEVAEGKVLKYTGTWKQNGTQTGQIEK